MLTDEQLRQFRDDGFLVFEALIQGERLAYYKQVFDELVTQGSKITEQTPHWALELDERGEPRAGLLHKVQGVCVVDDRVLELAREPAIIDRVALLIGENIDVFGTKFFPKLPMAARQRAGIRTITILGPKRIVLSVAGYTWKIQVWRMDVCGWFPAATG